MLPAVKCKIYANQLKVFDKIFNIHQIGSVQVIVGPIQVQLHRTTSYNVQLVTMYRGGSRIF